MIKRIKKWIEKQEVFSSLLWLVMLLTLLNELIPSSIFQSAYRTLMIPAFIFLLKKILEKTVDNNEHNIDINLTDNCACEYVWKIENSTKDKDSSYINIINVGNINVYSLFVKVVDYKNVVNYYIVKEDLPSREKIFIMVPYCIADVKEVIVSCKIPSEYRTKRFYGVKSGDSDNTIFGKMERYELKNKAIIFDDSFEDKAEEMIKYRL